MVGEWSRQSPSTGRGASDEVPEPWSESDRGSPRAQVEERATKSLSRGRRVIEAVSERRSKFLSLDRNLVNGDEVVQSSSFSACRHDCGRDCRSAVLRGDHYCDVVWWSMWSELSGAARDVVDVVAVDVVGARWSRPGRGRCGPWST